MLKGRDLIGYTLNQMGGDKLLSLYKLADELLDLNDITRRAVSLINPVSQYSFLEDIILGVEDSDNKIIEYLKSYSYPLPRRWGWKQTRIANGKEELIEHVEWFEKEHDCYCDMFKSVMCEIRNAVDCCDDISIKNTKNAITIDAIGVKEIFEMYEME